MDARKLERSPHDYVICSTQRSGSTLLCELLTGTGIAGRPEEHFQYLVDTEPRSSFFADLADPDVHSLLTLLPLPPARTGDVIGQARLRSTTPNGVFATKLQWGDLDDLAAYLGRAADADLMRLLTPRLRCVHLVRRDAVAQAVSLWKAAQTGAWQADRRAHREPVYHFGAIDHLHRLVIERQAAWGRWFATAGVDPLTVTYEDLAADPRGTVTEVLEFIGIDAAVTIPSPKLRRQSDERSADWIARYARDAG